MAADLRPDPDAERSDPSLLYRLRARLPTFFENLGAPRKAHSDPSVLQFLANGKSGIIYEISHKKVLKVFNEEKEGEFERTVYRRLGLHPNITKLLATNPNGSLILERGKSLRRIFRTSTTEIPLDTKVRWLRDAAKGYQHLHSCDIVHGDVGCSNLILIPNGHVKLIDFEGCSVDGRSAGSCYEWFSYRRSEPRVTQATDIFAFGCTMYEVITGQPPYSEFEKLDEPHVYVEDLYEKNQFPDTADLPLGGIIYGCWHGNFSSMIEVIQELEKARPKSWKSSVKQHF